MPTVITPTSPQPPNSTFPKSEKSGVETAPPSSSGGPLLHDLGSMSTIALMTIATTVPTMMPIRIAPGMLRAWSMKMSSRVTQKMRTGQPHEFTGRAEGDGGRLALVDESGLVEADEGDEEPDAHGDAVLERERDRVHDHLAEAGDHQEADHHTVDHTHAHGLRPGHVGRDLRGEHAGDAEPGGERQGHLPDEAHEQGRRGRREGGRGDQAGLAEEVAVDVLPAQDQRVEQKDVRHGHEGRDAAAQLARDGGSSFGYVEVPVEP